MSNSQLYLMIGVPVLINTALFGLFFARMKAHFDRLDRRFDAFDDRCRADLSRFSHIEERRS